jgi:transposase
MPELGQLTAQEAAALAGLAPYNCDSGAQNGPRRIKGGRTAVMRKLIVLLNHMIKNPEFKLQTTTPSTT